MKLYDVYGKVIYESEEAKTTKELAERAVIGSADLRSADLHSADLRWADLSWADLRWADLSWADLRWADLSWADLRWADLSWADLRWANLSWADLRWANLSSANLGSADGIVPALCTPLLMLLDQPESICAYKLVNSKMEGPYNGGIKYTIGEMPEVENANTDPNVQCATGINLATLDWCLKEWKPCYRVMICEFTAADIACIPTATDGKFRVHRCEVVGEKDLTGLVPEGEPKDMEEKAGAKRERPCGNYKEEKE